jgi:anthranilate phosphoribosyltransferase
MASDLHGLHKIDQIISKLIDGNNLTSQESEEVFSTVIKEDKKGFYFTALMSAIHAKGETADELLGLMRFYKENSAIIKINAPTDKITDLSGTGAGSFKTFNVSTTASFVVAAAGYVVGKASYYGITSQTGSADLFGIFGIDLSRLSKALIEETLNQVGICPFYIFFISPKLENRGKLFKMVYRDEGLRVRTPGHLTTNAYSPFPVTHRIYGCYSERYLEILANLFQKLGYKKTLTFFADIGLPEISNVGKTTIVEQNGGHLKRYIVNPADLGVEEATKDDIKTGGKEQNIADFIKILQGKEKGAKQDLVAINAGAALYALEDVKTVAEGTKKAQQILKSGEGYIKLEQLVKMIGSPQVLKRYT